MKKDRKLVLETGQVFEGNAFGADAERVAELVYNTAVVGYQETLSDPSNMEYIMVMGYPVIGSYGLTDEDYESSELTISGLVVREYSKYPSNFRYTHELAERMDETRPFYNTYANVLGTVDNGKIKDLKVRFYDK